MGGLKISSFLLVLSFAVFACWIVNVHLVPFATNAVVQSNTIWSFDAAQKVKDRYSNTGNPAFTPSNVASFYFFNITNADDVREGAKPILEQVGPFQYTVHTKKQEVWYNTKGEVSFKPQNYYVPLPGTDDLARDTHVVVPNIALLGVLEMLAPSLGHRLQRWLAFLAGKIESFDKTQWARGVFVKRSVQELMWGYHEPLLALLARWVPEARGMEYFQLLENTTTPEEASVIPPCVVQGGSAGELMGFREWRGTNEITCWNTSAPVPIGGHDATQFSSFMHGGEVLTAWVGSLFRPVHLTPQQCYSSAPNHAPRQLSSALHRVHQLHEYLYGPRAEKGGKNQKHNNLAATARDDVSQQPHVGSMSPCSISDYNGLELLRYEIDPRELEANSDWYTSVRGLFNVSSCKAGGPGGTPDTPGLPLFLTLPHLCGVDADVAAGVSGVSCDREKHTLYLDIEPVTGATIRGKKRIMINTWLSNKWEGLDPDVPTTLLPFMWFEEAQQATQDTASRLAQYIGWLKVGTVVLTSTVWVAVAGGLLVAGLVLMVVGSVRGRGKQAGQAQHAELEETLIGGEGEDAGDNAADEQYNDNNTQQLDGNTAVQAVQQTDQQPRGRGRRRSRN